MAVRLRAMSVGLAAMLPVLFALASDPSLQYTAGQAPRSRSLLALQLTDRPILLTGPVPDPHQPGVLWFSPTGHTLRGAFLDYWQRYGGLAQFGYPLTEEFYEPVEGKSQYLVQYFERNRFEWHPKNQGTRYQVLLGALGRDFHPQDPPASPLPGAAFFPETGHNLSGRFRTYWEVHGGLFVHGYPITEQFEEQSPTDGKTYTVQYFERSRFEWHPENAGSDYEVLLGLLGRQLSETKGYPNGRYPAFGRAADWSWVAGRLIEYAPYCCGMATGCSLLQYQEAGSGAPVQLEGNGWWTAAPEMKRVGNQLVVLGHLWRPGEDSLGCGEGPNITQYTTEHTQSNPLPIPSPQPAGYATIAPTP